MFKEPIRQPRAIAVIPARGGSKRLPRKNYLPFEGRPLIAWTIEAALRSKVFDRVVVSTEDINIADIGRSAGAEVPVLRDRAFDDHTPVSEATCVTLEQLGLADGRDYDVVVQLMCNCPLRTAQDIVDAMSAFNKAKVQFQISCFRYGWMNPWWASTLDANGTPTPLFANMFAARSQDQPTLYCPSGAIWIANVPSLMASRTFYGPGHVFFPISWQSAVDIDDADDLEMAKTLFALRTRSQLPNATEH